MLASQLIVQPDLLLLDEPTNHLDLARTEWLEEFLREYPGTCIIISHDRYFLDRVVTKTIEIEDGEAFSYQGGYTAFMKDKEERLLQQFADYQEQQKVIKKMKESIKQLEEFGRIGGNEKFLSARLPCGERWSGWRRSSDLCWNEDRPISSFILRIVPAAAWHTLNKLRFATGIRRCSKGLPVLSNSAKNCADGPERQRKNDAVQSAGG